MMAKICGHCRDGFHGLCGGSAMAPYYTCPCSHGAKQVTEKDRDGETETVLVADGTACGACGETFHDGQEIAEVYDPSNPDESDIVHEECIPVGWQIA